MLAFSVSVKGMRHIPPLAVCPRPYVTLEGQTERPTPKRKDPGSASRDPTLTHQLNSSLHARRYCIYVHFAFKEILQCPAARTRAGRRSDVKGLTVVALDPPFLTLFGRATCRGYLPCALSWRDGPTVTHQGLYEGREIGAAGIPTDLIDPGAARTYACSEVGGAGWRSRIRAGGA